EVHDKLGLRGLIRRGVHTIPVDKIVGSVGRYGDFDNAFLPTSNALSDRWRKINRAFYDDINLPPVTVYMVGGAYFVLDGNHRVSVAREHGVQFLDAEVFEAVTRAPVHIEDFIDADHLEVLGEYSRFLERTQLDRLRPQQDIQFTTGGAYEQMIEHIAVHRYFMGLEQKRTITEDEAVIDWYDNVYMPVIDAVREEKILKEFPGRTESDLYLWIIDHLYYLRENCQNCDVDVDEAATSYATRFGERSPLERMQQAIAEILHPAGKEDKAAEGQNK
ncbi:MAG: DUF4032 domain-containing protein, partial [Chloroflexi bacterium]|nr:DUF4032 domain-containing protein [Chloroflexota bacterium]